MRPSELLRCAPLLVLLAARASAQDPALVQAARDQEPPAIDITTGHEIPSKGYCDQPYLVKLADGTWLCTMTTGDGHEGQSGQHIVSCRSRDRGATWSELVAIEPPTGPEASWAMPYLTAYGRVYVFYTYNADNRRQVEAEGSASTPWDATPSSTPTMGGAPGQPTATSSPSARPRSTGTTPTPARSASSGESASPSATTVA